MLNINQNFDLKAPVFNFDRDYFNSVDELNAYDTSNVPDHFVTNVAGMLYQFTDGKWLPMIGTEFDTSGNHYVKLGCANAFIALENNEFPSLLEIDGADGSEATLKPDSLKLRHGGNKILINVDRDGHTPTISLTKDYTYNSFITSSDIYCSTNSNHVYIKGGESCIEMNDAQGRYAKYTSHGFSLDFSNKIGFLRPDTDEGAIITGVKSITAFTNPSATKVWATDGSTVDLSTKANVSDLDAKANKSDVLLKKSESGGYYIEENSNKLGSKAFATNSTCSASGVESHAEGHSTRTTGGYSHAEGWQTLASGVCSHTEGEHNEANGYCSHAQGSYNVSAKDVIHSVGIGTIAVRKNAEYIYAKNNTNGSALADDPKNGYKYLIGVGGYDGISTDNTTYKSVQEVIADLTARIEQLETKVKALEDANTPA